MSVKVFCKLADCVNWDNGICGAEEWTGSGRAVALGAAQPGLPLRAEMMWIRRLRTVQLLDQVLHNLAEDCPVDSSELVRRRSVVALTAG